jgi:glyoxylase-like metal-dependent hydrolase (beta-lactamase superfamily II)
MMSVETITVGAFAMNCYLVYDDASRQAIFIDPGLEAERLIKRAEDLNLKIKFIVNTHAHIDHVAETGDVQAYFKVPFFIHSAELPLLNSIDEQAAMFGITPGKTPEVTAYLDEQKEIEFSGFTGKILHTPGHSPGGISIYFKDHVFVGDCLFMDSIGRTDLYKGDYEQLINSIRTHLFSLPDDTKVYSGHGPATTIGREKLYNPFLQ